MKVRFFLGINDELVADHKDLSHSFLERTKQVLAERYQVLEKLVAQAASDAEKNVIPVVICGEDFFKGGEISTSAEEKAKSGECMDRDTVFKFFAENLVKLSAQFPSVLIIPGSVYVSVKADSQDKHHYTQEGEHGKKANIYVQNVAPVFYNGEWIRLIKKGNYLEVQDSSDKQSKKLIKTEEEFKNCLAKSLKANVPEYHEDTLADMNQGLIFFGETPLPGEQNALSKNHITEADFSNPVFTMGKNITFGLEICGDHSKYKLKKYIEQSQVKNLDVHIVTSNGIGYIYDATQGNGYRVQADAESKDLTGVTSNLLVSEDKHFPTLKHRLQTDKSLALHQSDALPAKPAQLLKKYQQKYLQLLQQMELMELKSSKVKSGVFHGQSSRYVRDLKALIEDLENKKTPSKKDFEQINRTASFLGKNHLIAIYARSCATVADELIHLGFSLEKKSASEFKIKPLNR